MTFIKITAIDREGSRITGKDIDGHEHSFRFRLGTELHVLEPQPQARTLLEILRANGGVLPFAVHQQVLVSWQVGNGTELPLAVRVTLLPPGAPGEAPR